jgi:hypothetical protein
MKMRGKLQILCRQRVSTMRCFDFIVLSVYNETPLIFKMLSFSYIIQEFKFPPKYLGYFIGHHWGAPVVLK